MHDTRLLADHGETSIGDDAVRMTAVAVIGGAAKAARRGASVTALASARRVPARSASTAARCAITGSAALMPPLDFIPRDAGCSAVR
jgi:hypothetical protein